MKIEELIQLIEAVSTHKISKFEYKNESGEKISMEKNEGMVYPISNMMHPTNMADASMIQPIPQPAVQTSDALISADMKSNKVITSPLVGTFYAAPAPGKESFVKVGDTVKVGQVVGIIEAMKLMNEVESEVDGIIEEILISDEEVVEYGQPLFRVR